MSATYFVYIIRSLSQGIYYKGFTENIEHRLEEHNKGLSKFTSRALPWELVYLESHPTKKDALSVHTFAAFSGHLPGN